MPNVTMTVEEYLDLVAAAGEPSQLTGRTMPRTVKMTTATEKRLKRKGKPDPKMSRALKKANEIGRTKSGKLRKGYTQARIMQTAHKLRRKM
jgi:hypothetical protein